MWGLDLERLGRPVFATVLALAVAAHWAIPVVGQGRVRSSSSDSDSVSRPKIGLALAGGGAKGGAHIGVLEVLEELRVPVDYIAGTSIGAVVGGLYASGMSVPELKALMESLDWQELLSDRIPLRYKPVRLKNLNGKVPSRLEIGFNGGAFRLPTAIVTGQNVDRTLRTATFSVAHVEDFSDLTVPFVAVATDLVTGELVTLAGGNLASAIRASMSIPGAFSPVEIDGRVLVDGGLVRNLPVDVVREMGADVVIAVDLTPPLYEAEDLRSALEISAQTLRISLLQNTVPQRETLVAGRDVLLRPDVDAVAITDFRSLTRTIPIGAAGARELGDELAAWSLDSLSYQDYRESRKRRVVDPPTLEFVRVEGVERVDPSILLERLDLPTGEPLSAERLERALTRVFALELYQSVDYTLVEEEGRSGLVIEVVEKPWGPGFLRLGLAFSDDLERGQSSLVILVNHAQTQINRRGGALLTELRLVEAQRARMELFQPLDMGGTFYVAPAIDYREEVFDVTFLGAGEVSRGVREFKATLALGVQLQDWGKLRVELLRGRVWQRESSSALPGSLDAEIGGVRASFLTDLLDGPAFPRSGTRAHFEAYRSARSLGADPSYTRLEGSFLAAVSAGRNTVLAGLRAGGAVNSTLPVHDDFSLGGFRQLSGLRPRDLVGNQFAFGHVTFRRRLANIPAAPEGGNLYLGFSAEAGNAWSESRLVRWDNLIGGASLFLGMETLFGPLYLAYGHSTLGDDTVHLLLGRAF